MEEKKRGILGSILFWGILLLITVIFVLVLLNFLGVPVWKTFQNWGNKIPIVNYIVPDSTKSNGDKSNDSNDWKGQYMENQSILKKRDQQITELKKQLIADQNDLKVLKKSNEDLQKQLENKQTQEGQAKAKQVSGIYASMPASKAAAMITAMPLDEAALTMSQLDQELQGSIIGSMKDVKKAAQITMLMKEIATLNITNQLELQEVVHELALKQDNPTEILAETIAGMPADQSAELIKTMMSSNSQVALTLMKNINTPSRSQILAVIAKSDPKLAAQIAASLNN